MHAAQRQLRDLIAEPADVGPAIAAAREAAGLSQADLAAAFGGTQPQVAAWEAGRKVPSLRSLQLVYAALANLRRTATAPAARRMVYSAGRRASAKSLP